jgi:hypothetical protein
MATTQAAPAETATAAPRLRATRQRQDRHKALANRRGHALDIQVETEPSRSSVALRPTRSRKVSSTTFIARPARLDRERDVIELCSRSPRLAPLCRARARRKRSRAASHIPSKPELDNLRACHSSIEGRGAFWLSAFACVVTETLGAVAVSQTVQLELHVQERSGFQLRPKCIPTTW